MHHCSTPPTLAQQHPCKKQFQPSIATYFEVRDGLHHCDHLPGLEPITRLRHQNTRPIAHPRDHLASNAPPHVQADLLSVGMRVRKSVPEGYKTHKMLSSPSDRFARARPRLDIKPPPEAVPDHYQHQRELLPFCGLHNIGGFAEQPTTNPHLYTTSPNRQRPTIAFPLTADAFTQPFPDQSSADSGYDSTTSPSSQRLHNPSKRSWHDEDEVRPLNTNFLFNGRSSSSRGGNLAVEFDDVPVSPLSETPTHGINSLPPVRQFAQPRSRRTTRRTISDDDIDMDFENAARIEGRVGAGSNSDFEEADFLGDEEVHMSGV
ncbi:hypothetical protein COCMIDRAFT_95008 [Bipolaris oryzae ATCC 44560]|uniref:Uncharacterized protein n=1 Tax=Bipolaris oryzae ATCC 44560 TaxID=930090 RepID=W6Z6Q5_COCMI|nr:uncharacterized protein COCMIDRAFT_95008 [Bipolaris oryzae ATCC 44560]EUC45660.1 hypothetical protein COCMIDRAFT_95008 [Bipolaris oryzae ATCC 44560]